MRRFRRKQAEREIADLMDAAQNGAEASAERARGEGAAMILAVVAVSAGVACNACRDEAVGLRDLLGCQA